MITNYAELITYPAPAGAVLNSDFTVRVRLAGKEWTELSTYLVPVDMHHVRETSIITHREDALFKR